MLKSRNFLMTGATGYLGSHLLRLLVEHGANVTCLKRSSSKLARVADLADKVAWVDVETFDAQVFFPAQRTDYILHCATDYGRKQVDPIRTIEANLILPLKLLHSGAANSVKGFINTDTILDKGVNNYSLSKKQFLDWLVVYSDRIVGVNMALEHFFGPGDDPSKFVTSTIQALLRKVPSIDFTPGLQRRDFIYIDDVTGAFKVILENMPSFEKRLFRFEVGTGRPVEIRQFAHLAKQLTGNSTTLLNFGAIPYRSNEVMYSRVDTTGLESLGWAPQISLEDGLKKTIENER